MNSSYIKKQRIHINLYWEIVLEALFGAILIDQGYEKAKQIFTEKSLKALVDFKQVIIKNRDFKSELFMLFQKKIKL